MLGRGTYTTGNPGGSRVSLDCSGGEMLENGEMEKKEGRLKVVNH